MERFNVPGLARVEAEVVYAHVFGNADREVGGVLVGRAAGDGGMPLVTGAISALHADEQRATLTFTQDAWEHVHRTLERGFPDDDIVGWYHSHPGFGVFLSEHDLFIHRNFFSGRSQIALVVDPIAGTEGTFVWQDGEIVALPERPTAAPWSGTGVIWNPARAAVAGPAATPRGTTPAAVIAAALAGLVIGFGGWSLLHGSGESQPANAHGPAPAQPRELFVKPTTRSTRP